MSTGHYFHLCNRYKGRAVEIRTRNGVVHRGVIRHVNRNQVFLDPIGNRQNFGGFGYGFFGPSYRPYGAYGPNRYRRYRLGFGAGIALGAIGTLILLPFFF
ncbi:hypothetical protein ACLIBG_10175 [Virgibacillus sp. W0181]|uniref:hypothetical protein n=1 Tax=Virgibacillus sp. W0181 TaxID=3391581 RepID=UPI003F48FB67